MDVIIPSAGLSTRMRGLPKFLLPVDKEYKTLLENHLDGLTNIDEKISKIWIATRPQLVPIINTLDLTNPKVEILGMETSTMNETLLNVCNQSIAKNFLLIMPDTYFLNMQPYDVLDIKPNVCDLAIWKIKKEQRGKLGEVSVSSDTTLTSIVDKNPDSGLEYSWGALTFSEKLLDYVDIKDSHIGYAVEKAFNGGHSITTKKINGEYFDCGTPEEYISLIKKILI